MILLTDIYLHVSSSLCNFLFQVPPTIIDSRTSPDIIVKEGSSVNFTCEAIGAPEPKIMWKREDNKLIKFDRGQGNNLNLNSLVVKHPVNSSLPYHIDGELFCIHSISHSDFS